MFHALRIVIICLVFVAGKAAADECEDLTTQADCCQSEESCAWDEDLGRCDTDEGSGSESSDNGCDGLIHCDGLSKDQCCDILDDAGEVVCQWRECSWNTNDTDTESAGHCLRMNNNHTFCGGELSDNLCSECETVYSNMITLIGFAVSSIVIHRN